MSEMKEAYQAYLISPCAVGDELPIAFEAGYLAGQASVEERVKELEQERDEAVRQWERFERMAGDNWAALKAQAGEPVAWQHRQRGLKEYEWQEWQTVGYKPQGPESQTFQMRPLFTHPTTERPYNPLNDYAVIPMNPTEPVKAQAGEPDFYVRRRPSPGYEVVSSSDPMAQPAYLHSTTERRVIPEDAELLAFAADEQFFLFCEELEVLDIMRTTLQKYLNAAPAKGEV